MGFQLSAKAYDHALVDALERALKEVLQVLAAHDPDIDVESAATKAILAAKLISLADSGIRDPHQLRNKTLRSLSLGPFH
jgi:hypothetical protein